MSWNLNSSTFGTPCQNSRTLLVTPFLSPLTCLTAQERECLHLVKCLYSPLAMVEWSLCWLLHCGNHWSCSHWSACPNRHRLCPGHLACAVHSFLLVSATRVRSSTYTAMHLDVSVSCELALVQEKEISSRRILNVFTTSKHLKCLLHNPVITQLNTHNPASPPFTWVPLTPWLPTYFSDEPLGDVHHPAVS